jgi:sortase (surface protein transpeptidase)
MKLVGINTPQEDHSGIFAPITSVVVGDEIILNDTFRYTVGVVIIVPDTSQNAQWVQPTNDTRVTLVTCLGNLRLIIIAFPEG